MGDSAAATGSENITALQLPPYCLRNPRVWFHQIEAVFVTRHITSQSTKFLYVIQSLPGDVAAEVEDLLENIPSENPYDVLRTAIITRTGQSETKMLRDLFTTVELGDRTPSQLLRHMRSLLGGKKLEEGILRQLWLDKLPTNMCHLLTAFAEDSSLERLASMGDKIMESYPNKSVCTTTKTTCEASEVSQCTELKATINQMSSRMDDLVEQINALRTRECNCRSRSRSRRRAQWCYYHRRFGRNAVKCEKPCSFTPRLSSPSNHLASQ